MGIPKCIWVKRKRFYYYDIYSTWQEAKKIAKWQKKKNKSRYFILEYEHGYIIPHKRYILYLDKVYRITIW